jgi:hypothetical protein
VLKRLFAILLLFSVPALSAESVGGELRDGRVHHEPAANAALHAAWSQGDHGHEDGGPLSHHHGGGHLHGTGADHCTHQHGAGVPHLAFAEPLPEREAGVLPAEPAAPAALFLGAPFRPPRA